MAVERDRPYGRNHFRVTLGGRSRRDAPAAGFSGVVLPRLLAHPDHREPSPVVAPVERDPSPHLVLHRGFTGALDLYRWWDDERGPTQTRGRVVTVELLDDASHEPVVAWRFTGCRPVALDYSALDALESAVMTETLTLAFEAVEIA